MTQPKRLKRSVPETDLTQRKKAKTHDSDGETEVLGSINKPSGRARTTKVETEISEETDVEAATPSRSASQRKLQVKVEELEETADQTKGKKQTTSVTKEHEVHEGEPTPKKTTKRKGAGVKEEEGEEADAEDTPKKTVRKRKTKEEKEAEAMPLAARTNGLQMFIGAHVSCAKGMKLSCEDFDHCKGSLPVKWSIISDRTEYTMDIHSANPMLGLSKTDPHFTLGVQNSVTNCAHIG